MTEDSYPLNEVKFFVVGRTILLTWASAVSEGRAERQKRTQLVAYQFYIKFVASLDLKSTLVVKSMTCVIECMKTSSR